jgi:hypothetical protein
MSKVYLITCGDYEDYHVEKVFLDENKAKNYLEVCDRDDFFLETFDSSDDKTCVVSYYIEIEYSSEYYGNIARQHNEFKLEIIKSNTLDMEGSVPYKGCFYNKYYCCITLHIPLSSNNFNEDKLRTKYENICDDIVSQAKSLEKDKGWNCEQINEWLNNYKFPVME